MSESRQPLSAEQVVDLLVYLPLGLLAQAQSSLPDLVAKGKAVYGTRVMVARMVGQFAVAKGRIELDRAVTRLREAAPSSPGAVSGSAEGPATPPAAGSTPPAPAPAPAVVVSGGEGSGGRPTDAPDDAALPIPDYDLLAASQVVPRLAGLDRDDLEAVRAYEAAHRARRTILNRIAQLSAAG